MLSGAPGMAHRSGSHVPASREPTDAPRETETEPDTASVTAQSTFSGKALTSRYNVDHRSGRTRALLS